MTVNTTNITGFVVLPDDTVREKSYVQFTMTGFDTDADDNATVVTFPIDAPIAADGSINVNLWPNPEGVRSTFYRVTFVIYNGVNPHYVDGGLIEVPVSGGPYDLNDLLPISPPSGATVEEYIAQLQAAAGSASSSAVDAASSASDAASSASDAALYDGPKVDTFSDVASVAAPQVPVGGLLRVIDADYVYERAPDAAVDADLDYIGAGGLKWYVSSKARVVTPAMFGIVGVTSVGDIDIVGTGSIPDETSQFQKMFDHALKYGCEIDMGATDRDYGLSSTIVVEPQTARNKGNINAVVAGGSPLQLHFSNMPSVIVRNPGNSRIVALAPMASMFRIDNIAAVASTAPYWTEWHGLNLHGNGLAVDAFATTYSYRNLYHRCKVYGFENGWQAINDAGSHWAYNEINCTKRAVYLDNAGDCTITGGDISVQRDGVVCGGGNNVRVQGVTFTGNVFVEPEMVGVKLFGGSTVTADPRTRGVHISGCEGAGLDYLVKGVDSDADGKKEIWNVTITDNHIVRTAEKPNIGMAWVKNGYGISLVGNGHGDLLNSAGAGPSVYLEGCETFSIRDSFHLISGKAVHAVGCNGGVISSVFSDCANTVADPVVLLHNSNEVSVSGNAFRWRVASPTVTAAVEETGTSNRNRAEGNAIDTSKLARPYIRLGAQSSFEHKYYGTTTFNPGTVSAGAGGTEVGISVPGARFGDSLSLGFAENTKGLQFDAYITAADTVNVAYKNETGGSQTITSGTMTIEARSR